MKIKMKLVRYTTIFLLVAFITSFTPLQFRSVEVNAATNQNKYVEDEIIVKYKENTDISTTASKKNGKVAKNNKKLKVAKIKIPKGKSISQSIEEYKVLPEIEYAEPNYIFDVSEIPNDPSYGAQWGLNKINANLAWDTAPVGNSDVMIAVIDSGVDADHPDLSASLVQGYNTLDGSSNTNDDMGHGTHVAGIAAGIKNNNIGIAGVASGVKIMPIKVFTATGGGSSIDIVDGIVWAVDNYRVLGASKLVINMSLGGTGISTAMQEAINYAHDNGVIVIASMGNSNTSIPSYPAAFNNVIAVAATNNDVNNTRASFSNYGSHTDIAAPGVDIFSTTYDGAYGYKNGTSMAAPFVAGVAALIWSYRQELSEPMLESVLLQSAKDIGTLGKDSYFGYGLIDALSALTKPVSTKPNVGNITVINNAVGTSDKVTVTGLAAGDVVKVYSAATGGTLLGSATVATGVTTATVTIAQLGTVAGNVYISVTSTGKIESDRTAAVSYIAEPVSTTPATNNIKVTNNAVGTADTVEVTGLVAGDVVKVYSAATFGTAIGTAKVAVGASTAKVAITQLGAGSGNVYVSVTSTGKLESARTVAIPYAAEQKSTTPAVSNIVVTNNAVGTPDTVEVTGLVAGDVVKVYSTATLGTAIGTSKVAVGATSAKVTIAQIGAGAGNVYVSVTSVGKLESSRTTAVPYIAEQKSTTPAVDTITVTNNTTGKADTVVVTGLAAGDIVKVYSVASGGTALGTTTVAAGATTGTVTIAQLGTLSGNVYVSVKSKAKLESDRTTAIAYIAEPVSTTPAINNINVTNNAVGTPDTVEVTGLVAGDVVKVYSAATLGTAIGTAKVGVGASTAKVTIAQLGAGSGNVYVSVTSTGKLESPRTAAVAYIAEQKSITPAVDTITVTNNTTGKADTVVVTGLAAGDIVKVYSVASGGTAIGTATVAAGTTTGTVTITQLGTLSGNVYVSVTNKAKLESDRTTAIAYIAEPVSTTPAISNISVTNNAVGTSDTVEVTGLVAGDVVKVYSAATLGTAIGTAKVAVGASTAKVTIAQIGAGAGNVYVSVTSTGKLESPRTAAVTYVAEQKSIAPVVDNITVTNNTTGKADTVVVTGLVAGDIVKVYSVATGGTALGTATVAVGTTTGTVTITQLGTLAGNVYVSVTNKAKLESDRTTAIAYIAEPVSTTPAINNIKVTNNTVGTPDSVEVTGLAVGDVVKVYSTATLGTAIGTAKVAVGATSAKVTVAQLGLGSGNVYVSVTSVGKLESPRTTAIAFIAEP